VLRSLPLTVRISAATVAESAHVTVSAPLLVVVGLKMVAQDFKYSRPATLFIALALYGVALIVAPRLRRSGRKGRPVQAVEA